jgi:hypothetical protein
MDIAPSRHLLKIDRLRAQIVLQRKVVIVQHFTQLLGKTLGTQQVLQAQAAARHLVFVGWTDAAPGGADFLRALGCLAGDVKCLMVGQDQRAGFRDAQARIGIDSSGLELVEFLDQRVGREHHAVADIARDAFAQDARGHQVQDGLFAADDQRMPGVMPTLVAHHGLGVVGQPVDDLALALVAPLGTDNHDVLCHFSLP